MLILGRKLNQSILVDTGREEIRLFVVAIRGNSIRLGFEAPRHVIFDRDNVVLERGQKKTVSKAEAEAEDPTPKGPNVEVAQKLREIADAIEGFDFPVNADFDIHKSNEEEIERVKAAFSEYEFEDFSSRGGLAWSGSYLVPNRVKLVCFKSDEAREVSA